MASDQKMPPPNEIEDFEKCRLYAIEAINKDPASKGAEAWVRRLEEIGTDPNQRPEDIAHRPFEVNHIKADLRDENGQPTEGARKSARANVVIANNETDPGTRAHRQRESLLKLRGVGEYREAAQAERQLREITKDGAIKDPGTQKYWSDLVKNLEPLRPPSRGSGSPPLVAQR